MPVKSGNVVKPGDVLAGKYRLVSLLGEGGMGCVWRAEHLQLEAAVAIKLMHPSVAASAAGRVRFEREAKAAASVRSPHVVQVLDFGIDAVTSAPFIAMELLHGESLRARLARMPVIAPLDVARIVIHVARALGRAHEGGVVHRDLKPANVFLLDNDDALFAKVLDFGIVKWSRNSLDQALTTTSGELGTPHYMSPEQINSSKDVDFRTDLWSLGVIAFECLTGKLPFDGGNLPAIAFSIRQARAPRPSALGRVPRGFDEWFARATALAAHERYLSASEMALELRRLCEASARATVEGGEARLSATTLQPARSQPAVVDARPAGVSASQTRRRRV